MLTFEKWLAQNHSNTAELLNAFGMLSLLCRKEKLTNCSLSFIEDAEDIERILKNLDGGLQKYGEESCSEFRNVLSLYGQYLAQNESEEKKETLMDAIRQQGILFVDKRAQGGALWIIGGKELTGFVQKCRRRGVHFQFCPGGGKSTQRRDAWFVTGDAEFRPWQQKKMDI